MSFSIPEFVEPNRIYLLAILHFAIGTGAAIVASRKGYNLAWWLLLGAIGGTVALVTSLWLKPKETP